jgi:branched-chain amino acid transport system substrate-binding protein
MVGASRYDAFNDHHGRHEDGGKHRRQEGPGRHRRREGLNGLTGIIGGFDEIGEVVKPVQVQVVKEGLFRHFGVVTEPELIKP